MSNSSFFGSIKKNALYRINSFVNLFSNNDSTNTKNSADKSNYNNAFKYGRHLKPKFRLLLSQKDVILKLIALYHEHECLWNPACPEYTDANHQEQIWQEIANEINSEIPAQQIKRKVLTLRSKWERETTMAHTSFLDRNSAVYIPKLFYYSNFEFLNHIREKEQTLEDSMSDVTSNSTTTSESNIVQFINKTKENSESISGVTTQMTLPTKQNEVKKVLNKTAQLNNLCDIIKNDLQNVSDELFFQVKWKILDVLRSAELEQLNNASKISEQHKNETSKATTAAKDFSAQQKLKFSNSEYINHTSTL